MLNCSTKTKILLVTTEMHFLFVTSPTNQAFVRYLHLRVWVAEGLPLEARKSQQSEMFQFFV